VTLAEPGTVFVSDEVAARVQDTRVSIPLGPQSIRGFDDPVSVSRLKAVG
jgi:class 3 adenylate cyclase